jgi:hypothetical protein
MLFVALIYGQITKLNLTQKQKVLTYIIKQGQDFVQHELDNMNFSNQEISFQMQGTINQHLY